MKKLRVGLIIDNGPQPFLVWDFLRRSETARAYSVELLIVQHTLGKANSNRFSRLNKNLRRRGLKRFVDAISFQLLERMEQRFVRKLPKYRRFFQACPLDSIPIEKLDVNPVVTSSGLTYRYSPEDLEQIRRRNLDVLIRGGNGILRGEVLHVCRMGVVSFHHANNDVNRGGPPGFWEVFNREPSTGFIVQKLTEELDGGDVICKGAIATTFMYSLNRARLYIKANVFLCRTLEQMGLSNTLPDRYSKAPYSYPLYSTPGILVQFLYSCRTAFYIVTNSFRRFLKRSHRWSVAYIFVNHWKEAALWRSHVIENPPNRFLADPFIVHRDGRHICFVEDYSYTEKRGRISAFEITRNGYSELGIALREDFHLSYPFVFQHEDELYMCPETNEAQEIRIYKCTHFPLQWSLHQTLMRNVNAVDTSIFHHGDKWWLLTNVDSSDIDDYESELHVFCADHFDATNWTPHAKNPVIFDSLRARNGGLIIDQGTLYRVFQVQGWDMYGASMGVARITKLTDSEYEEEIQFAITPRFFPDICGTHSYTYSNGLSAVDFARIEGQK